VRVFGRGGVGGLLDWPGDERGRSLAELEVADVCWE
jgi:hypothetical protein